MKNNDLDEVKPIYIREPRLPADNEISLVELVLILIRHKTKIAITSALIITLGIAATFLIPKSYTYSTSLEIGSQTILGILEPLEDPKTLLSKIQYIYIPKSLAKQQPNKNIYKTEVSNPNDSKLIHLEIKSSEEQANTVTKILLDITRQATQDHLKIFNSIKTNLVDLKNQAEMQLATLYATKGNIAEKNLLRQHLLEIKTRLASLHNTREILAPMRSIRANGVSNGLIIIISTFLGILFGILAAFISEFIIKVQEQSNINKN